MDLGSIDFGALTIPVFIAIFGMGWKAYDVVVGKPLRTRLADLEEDVDAYRKEKDAELLALRQKVLG